MPFTPILAFPLRGKGVGAVTPMLAFRRVPYRHSGLEPEPMPVASWFIHECPLMGHEWGTFTPILAFPLRGKGLISWG